MARDITKMSRDELLARRVCCGKGCYNCPYDPPHKKGNKVVRPIEKRVRLGAHSKGQIISLGYGLYDHRRNRKII